MAHYQSEAGRAMQLIKKREIQQQDVELRKKRLEEDLNLQNIDSKFSSFLLTMMLWNPL
jgi:protein FAM50